MLVVLWYMLVVLWYMLVVLWYILVALWYMQYGPVASVPQMVHGGWCLELTEPGLTTRHALTCMDSRYAHADRLTLANN